MRCCALELTFPFPQRWTAFGGASTLATSLIRSSARVRSARRLFRKLASLLTHFCVSIERVHDNVFYTNKSVYDNEVNMKLCMKRPGKRHAD